MEARVTRIEVAFEHVRKDLDEIKADLKALVARVTKMPTSTEMWGMYAAVIALAFAVLGIILGALAYLKP